LLDGVLIRLAGFGGGAGGVWEYIAGGGFCEE
jgi:hypothetical protein